SSLGLCVPTNVILTNVTLLGVITPGCHGSGLNGMTPEWVTGVTLVDGTGTVRRLSRGAADESDDFRAAKLSLGLLGLIYDLTIRVEPIFNLHLSDHFIPTTGDAVVDFMTSSQWPQTEAFWYRRADQTLMRAWVRLLSLSFSLSHSLSYSLSLIYDLSLSLS